jgi:hypothetical protein
MRYLTPTSVHDMVAAFLRAELASSRFGARVAAALQRLGQGAGIIEQPNIHDPGENYARERVLGLARGFRLNRELFHGFPDDVLWHRVQLSAAELAAARYIRHPYWHRLSNGTRSPRVVVHQILAGQHRPGYARFHELAIALRSGLQVPELIMVATSLDADLVVLEGHVRLTGYLLVPERLTGGLEVIVGCSPGLCRWDCY